MFGPVANSKIVSSSIPVWLTTPPKIRMGNSQPSSKSSLSSRPRGSSGAQLGNSVWFPDSKAATKSLPPAAARARGAWAGSWMRFVLDLRAAAVEADREHLVGLVEADEGAAAARKGDAHGLVRGGDAVRVEPLERLHHLEALAADDAHAVREVVGDEHQLLALRAAGRGAHGHAHRVEAHRDLGQLRELGRVRGIDREHRERPRGGVGHVEGVAPGRERQRVGLGAAEEGGARARGGNHGEDASPDAARAARTEAHDGGEGQGRRCEAGALPPRLPGLRLGHFGFSPLVRRRLACPRRGGLNAG